MTVRLLKSIPVSVVVLYYSNGFLNLQNIQITATKDTTWIQQTDVRNVLLTVTVLGVLPLACSVLKTSTLLPDLLLSAIADMQVLIQVISNFEMMKQVFYY